MDASAFVPDDNSRRDLTDLLAKILRDVAPAEVPMLADIPGLASPAVPAGSPASSTAGRVRRRGFPGVIEAGLVSLHLVAGTMALIDAYLKRKERAEQREFETSIRQEWQKALTQAGMSAELAGQIPVKFSADVIRFIATQRFREDEKRAPGERLEP